MNYSGRPITPPVLVAGGTRARPFIVNLLNGLRHWLRLWSAGAYLVFVASCRLQKRRHYGAKRDIMRVPSDPHGVEEVLIGLVFGEHVQKVLDGLLRGHVHEVTAKTSGTGHLPRVQQLFFLARAGLGDVE